MNTTPRPSLLNAYRMALQLLEALRPLLDEIGRCDRDLADQLRRAASSVVLNMAEAEGVAGRNRIVRRRTALGSLYEVRGALDVAAAFGYVARGDAERADAIAYAIGGALYRLVS